MVVSGSSELFAYDDLLGVVLLATVNQKRRHLKIMDIRECGDVFVTDLDDLEEGEPEPDGGSRRRPPCQFVLRSAADIVWMRFERSSFTRRVFDEDGQSALLVSMDNDENSNDDCCGRIVVMPVPALATSPRCHPSTKFRDHGYFST